MRAELDRKALAEVGQALAAAKELAPSHPHPRSPDTPPGNLAAAAGAGMVDRISDTVSGVAQGSVTAVQDLVALILGRRKRSAAPTGSKAARDTAQDVRGGASKLTDDAIAAAVRAKATASTATTGVKKTATTAADATKDTVRVAKKSAKRTAATARRSAKRTASTAKRSPATRPPARPVHSEEGGLVDAPHRQEGHVDDQLIRSACRPPEREWLFGNVFSRGSQARLWRAVK